MKAYQEYKDSGINWVGKLPSHWNAMPLKYAVIVNREALTEQIEDDFELQYIDIGNVNERGIINPPERMKFVDAPSRARRIIAKNDTIISTVRTYLKAVAFIESDDKNLIASTGFATLTSLARTYPKYLYYLVSSQGFVDTVSANSTGVSYPAITSTELAQITAWLPPLPEQQAIADFLDRKTAQIDTLIEKKGRQIDLLQEQRTALINHAVTKGLNPKVKMKDSGVEWLGEIPSHWEVKRIKHLVQSKKNAIKTGPFGSQLTNADMMGTDVKVYNQRSVIDNDFVSGDNYVSLEKFQQLKEFEIYAGDILITTRGTIGRCAIFPENMDRGILHPCLIRLQLDENLILKEYLIGFIQDSVLFKQSIFFESNATTIEVIYSGTMKQVLVPVPPVEEQQKIVEYLTELKNKVQLANEKLEKEISLLQEYRTALISEAVTGKFDVRTVHE